MFTKVLRKSVLLLVAYTILIIGIFVLQFKNDSIISEKIGSLHITLLESNSDNDKIGLKNKFSISFNGISISVSDDKPIKIEQGKTEKSVSLISWEKIAPLSCIFNFTDGVKLLFSLSDDSTSALLNVKATLPNNATAVSIPYGLSSGATMTIQGNSKLLVNNKKNSWELCAAEIDDNRIIFDKKNLIASYAYVDKTRSFSFGMTSSLEAAGEVAYTETIENLKNSIISSYNQIPADSTNVTEQEYVSYVAVMASKGKYPEAIESVPSSFKKSSSRTYLSAPYFNNLVNMNEILQRQMKTYNDMISLAVENSSLDVFTVKNIADYMCMHPGSNSIKTLLSEVVNKDSADVTVQQAAGVISVYDELYKKNRDLSSLLQPSIQKYVEKIENSCNLDDTKITIVEKGTFLSVTNAAVVGDALLRYGQIVNNLEYICCGRLIINSYLKDISSFDLRTLSELYPIVVHNNSYYPHYEVIGFGNKGAVWTWTCAQQTGYSDDNHGTITLTVDFPLSYTHYLIINGIEKFKSIYIYDMAFRTDYRFESYNSSGYVFKDDSNSLLLKSRHRSEHEVIRLIYEDEEQKQEEAIVESNVINGESNS